MKFYVQIFLISIICLKCAVIAIYFFQQPSAGFHTSAVAIAASDVSGADDAPNTEPTSDEIAPTAVGRVEGVPSTEPPEERMTQEKAQVALIEEKEKFLARREQQLLLLQEEINTKIEELTRLRDEIRDQIEIKKTVQENQVKHLIKIYSTMKPQKVAQLIEKLDISLITELFSRMKGDVVGQILSFVDTEIGAKITQGLFPADMEETRIP